VSRYPIDGKVRVRVVSNDLPRIAAAVKPQVALAVSKAAHDLEGHAKLNVVNRGLVDTGNLLRSIAATKHSELVWFVVVGATYGIYHEYGTRFMPARPFLLPAAELVRAAYLAAIAEAVKRGTGGRGR
jgi:HK97 gp10 family phage protein